MPPLLALILVLPQRLARLTGARARKKAVTGEAGWVGVETEIRQRGGESTGPWVGAWRCGRESGPGPGQRLRP